MLQTVLARGALNEIPQKRIARTQRKESQRRSLIFRSQNWKQPVDYLIGSPIPTHRQKLPIAAPISLARKLRGVPRRASLRSLQHNAGGLQPVKRRSHALAAPPSTRRRIDNCKKSLVHAKRLVLCSQLAARSS